MCDELDILGDREITPYARVCRLISHVISIKRKVVTVSFVHLQTPGEQFQKRRFASAVPADKRRYCSGREFTREAIECSMSIKTHRGLLKANISRFHERAPPCVSVYRIRAVAAPKTTIAIAIRMTSGNQIPSRVAERSIIPWAISRNQVKGRA